MPETFLRRGVALILFLLTGACSGDADAVLGSGNDLEVVDLSNDVHAEHYDGSVGQGLAGFGVVNTWVNGYWWGGAPQSVPGYGTACNVVWIIDRSGDALVHRALADFIRDFNTLSNAIGRTCKFPLLAGHLDDAHVGQCAGGTWSFPGYSFMTLCALPVPSPFGRGVSMAFTAAAGVSHYQPNVFIAREYADYNSTYSFIGHELGHALGLNHNTSDANSIMRPVLPVGVKLPYSAGDILALAAFYDSHVGP